MTAPLDLIVAPRPEPVAPRAPKSEKISGESEDRFADHLVKTDDEPKPSTPQENNATAAADTDTAAATQGAPTNSDRKISNAKPKPDDAGAGQPGAGAKTRGLPKEQDPALALTAQAVSLSPSPALSTAGPGAAPIVSATPFRIAENTVAERNIKDAPSGTLLDTTKLQKVASQSTAPVSQNAVPALNKTAADIPATPGILLPGAVPAKSAPLPLATPINPASAALADAPDPTPQPDAFLQKKIAPASTTVMDTKAGPNTDIDASQTLPISDSADTAVAAALAPPPAQPQAQPATPLTITPAAIPLPAALQISGQPEEAKSKNQPASIQADAAKPAPAKDIPLIKAAPANPANPAVLPPKHLLTPPDVAEQKQTLKHALRTADTPSSTGKADQTKIKKNAASVKVSDKSSQPTTPGAIPNAPNTAQRVPLPAHILQAAALDGAAPAADVQSGAGLPLSAAPVGERPSPFEPAATIRLNTAAGARPLPIRNIAVQMSKNLKAGINRFEIRIDPPEMGRIHIRMELTHDGRVQAMLSADRSDTLDLLQRDSKLLTQSLDKAGLNVDSGSLKFSLHDGGGQPSFGNSQRSFTPTLTRNTEQQMMNQPDLIATPVLTDTYGFRTSAAGGLNIQV